MKEAISRLTCGKKFNQSALVLTFDESYQETLKLALPICSSLKIPFCMFVTTEHLDGGLHMWNDCLFHQINEVSPYAIALPWMDRKMPTKSNSDRIDAYYRLLKHLLLYHEDTRKFRLNTFLSSNNKKLKSQTIDKMLTQKDIVSLSNNPWASFASHTHRHLPLSRLKPSSLTTELYHSRDVLESVAKTNFVNVLSYPFGSSEVISDHVIEETKKAGYLAAFTIDAGIARPANPMYRLPRICLTQNKNAILSFELSEYASFLTELANNARGKKKRLLEKLDG